MRMAVVAGALGEARSRLKDELKGANRRTEEVQNEKSGLIGELAKSKAIVDQLKKKVGAREETIKELEGLGSRAREVEAILRGGVASIQSALRQDTRDDEQGGNGDAGEGTAKSGRCPESAPQEPSVDRSVRGAAGVTGCTEVGSASRQKIKEKRL